MNGRVVGFDPCSASRTVHVWAPEGLTGYRPQCKAHPEAWVASVFRLTTLHAEVVRRPRCKLCERRGHFAAFERGQAVE